MTQTGESAQQEEIIANSPVIQIDFMRLQPIEIVLLSRVATESSTSAFPAIDECADDFQRQLSELPNADLTFAREVCAAFAQSPFPVDRDTLARHLIQPMTLADHDFGFSLLHQLVRDQHPEVRSEAYSEVLHSLNGEDIHGNERPVEEALAELGLTVEDAHELTHAFINAQYQNNLHAIGQTALAEDLQEATRSFQGFATLD
jgi:hypothetical protein